MKKNKKIPKGIIPDGWIPGRNKWKIPKTKSKKKPKSKKYANGYEVSIDNVVYESISKAADSLKIGHETARMRFKSKNFPNYRILSR